MMTFNKHKQLFAVLAAGLAVASAQAAPLTYFGQDLNAGLAVPVNSLSVASRNEFIAKLLPGSQSEGFESFATGTAASRSLFGGAATLTGAGRIEAQKCDPVDPTDCPGRFNTTGSPIPPNGTSPDGKWWETAGDFKISFNNGPVSAFGFFGTDFADFGGQLTLDLMIGTTIAETLRVNAGTQGDPNGSLLFFGFTDSVRGYDSIVFHVGQGASQDILGFDDVLIGALPTSNVPEPTTLALVSMSLLAGAAVRRRNKQV
jgi:hypothetical protein